MTINYRTVTKCTLCNHMQCTGGWSFMYNQAIGSVRMCQGCGEDTTFVDVRQKLTDLDVWDKPWTWTKQEWIDSQPP